MEGVLLGIAVLACPLGMGAMMWWMAKGMRRSGADAGRPADLDELREEHRQLGAEIEQLEDERAPRRTDAAVR